MLDAKSAAKYQVYVAKSGADNEDLDVLSNKNRIQGLKWRLLVSCDVASGKKLT